MTKSKKETFNRIFQQIRNFTQISNSLYKEVVYF